MYQELMKEFEKYPFFDKFICLIQALTPTMVIYPLKYLVKIITTRNDITKGSLSWGKIKRLRIYANVLALYLVIFKVTTFPNRGMS